MSIRTDRVGETVREVVAETLRTLADPRLEQVSITGCEVTADLSFARVYFSTLRDDDADRDSAQAALDRARGRFQAVVAQSLHTRRTPKLSFHPDMGILHGDRIEAILRDLDIAEDAAESAAPADADADAPPEGTGD